MKSNSSNIDNHMTDIKDDNNIPSIKKLDEATINKIGKLY